MVQGRVRAKQDRYRDFDRLRSMALLMHGDASFAGQGIVAEGLDMSELETYHVGGTVHVIVNNQVGFTTSPRDARSTTYCTGPARMLQIPIFHVNGEDMEAVAQAVLLATDFRQRFHRDAVIDLWVYRRHGHNEGDEPSFTQPVMYRAISRKPTLRQVYAEQLVRDGVLGPEDVQAMASAYRARLEEAYQASARIAARPSPQTMGGVWRGYQGGPLATGTSRPPASPSRSSARRRLALSQVPQGFHVHPKLARRAGGARRDGRAATGRSTGAWPRRWPTPPWPWRARGCGWWGRTRAAGPSATATRSCSTTRPACRTRRWRTCARGRGRSRSATACCRRRPRWASSTATAWTCRRG